MLRLDNLLQTIDDQDNPDYVEEHGPFRSVTSHWLGVGYYFWDSLMRRAHWWGDRHYGGNYMICKAWASVDEDKFLDLADNMEQLQQFQAQYELIQQIHQGKKITISFVINKLIRDGLFPYQAVRSVSDKCGGDYAVKFVEGNSSFLNFSPPRQICIYERAAIHDYHIVYPLEYIADCVV